MPSSSRRAASVTFFASLVSLFSVASVAHAQPATGDGPAATEAPTPPPVTEPAPTRAPETVPAATEPAPATPAPNDALHVKPWVLALDGAYFTRSEDTGFAYRTYESSVSSFILGGAYRADNFELELALPFARATSTYGDESHASVSFGNPTFGAYYAENHTYGRFRVGASISAPLAAKEGGDQGELVGAVNSRSGENAWLWLPDRFSIAASARLSNEENQGVQHVSELVLAPLIATGDHNDKAQFLVQASQSIGYRTGAFRFGVRGTIVAVPTSDSKDNILLSATPYVGGDFGAGFVDLGLNVNLNEPLGPFFDEGAFWGLRLRAGARF